MSATPNKHSCCLQERSSEQINLFMICRIYFRQVFLCPLAIGNDTAQLAVLLVMPSAASASSMEQHSWVNRAPSACLMLLSTLNENPQGCWRRHYRSWAGQCRVPRGQELHKGLPAVPCSSRCRASLCTSSPDILQEIQTNNKTIALQQTEDATRSVPGLLPVLHFQTWHVKGWFSSQVLLQFFFCLWPRSRMNQALAPFPSSISPPASRMQGCCQQPPSPSLTDHSRAAASF